MHHGGVAAPTTWLPPVYGVGVVPSMCGRFPVPGAGCELGLEEILSLHAQSHEITKKKG
jgi:hypothetical protein